MIEQTSDNAFFYAIEMAGTAVGLLILALLLHILSRRKNPNTATTTATSPAIKAPLEDTGASKQPSANQSLE